MATDQAGRLNQIQKAFRINLETSIYGTFAEIGAGQEVARHFFQAGGAAGTIAKTISAYDMTVSDAIYGKDASGRYVCEGRLLRMLDREFAQLLDRLGPKMSSTTRFFAFADTVAAKSFKSNQAGHGWLGLRFQHAPGEAYSEVVLHIRMLDNQNLMQQQAVGRIGVNLVYGCFYLLNDYSEFVHSLMDDLGPERLEIDMIRVRGPGFKGMDPRLINLELIKRGYSQSVIFDVDGTLLQPSDTIYRKNILLLRGSFRPTTLVNLDMLERGLAQFKRDLPAEEHENILLLPEISVSKLLERGDVDPSDFLARVDLLSAIGQKVIITSKETFYSLNTYLMELTKKKIAFVLGTFNLESILDEKSQGMHPHGHLAAIGALVGNRTTLYIYPSMDEEKSKVIHGRDVPSSKDMKLLLEYLYQTKAMVDITDYDPTHFKIWSRTVLKMIQQNQSGWEEMVPPLVAKEVITKGLFGHKR
jgi:hypothetical protein